MLKILHIWDFFCNFAVDKIRNHLKITIMKTYSYMGKQCAIHIPAENKKEAVKKLQEQGEKANMRNVYLLHKGVY